MFGKWKVAGLIPAIDTNLSGIVSGWVFSLKLPNQTWSFSNLPWHTVDMLLQDFWCKLKIFFKKIKINKKRKTANTCSVGVTTQAFINYSNVYFISPGGEITLYHCAFHSVGSH